MPREYDQKDIEKDVKQYWTENDVIKKVKDSKKNNDKFFLLDGPPYMSGPPHVGHMQGKVIKDVMIRFKWLQGYDVWTQAGFDTHGLPIEVATEEEMNIKNKNEIGEKISASKFIETCKKFATDAEGQWKKVMSDMAVWQDFDDPYLTFKKNYIETEWWLFKKAYDNGLLYQAKKPIHWCPRCQTSLSGYEVTDEYREVEDVSIYVKFPLQNKDENIVIWTTTPWTIPANMAVIVHPEFEYAKVKLNDEILIIANQLVDKVMKEMGYEEEEYKVIDTLYGSEIQGKKYVHPYLEEIPKQKEMNKKPNVHRIHVSKEMVSLEEGTGAVHTAPGHGIEDYQYTRDLGLPVFSPLDDEGVYTKEAGELEGKYIFKANDEIIEQLDGKGYLLYNSIFKHEYPHCWRCKTQLLLRATNQWFIKNEHVKKRILEENEDVKWIPAHTKERFKKFVQKSPDWCVSRQIYWGTPIPIWVCDECGQKEVIGGFQELSEKTGGLPKDFDPHKHMVDDLTWNCNCGGNYERIRDVLDVWFDSGSAPLASLHYPFENQETFKALWPVDFITEGSDQIRGWFYHLMFCGILAQDKKAFKKVLFQGFVLDAEGKKMSKSVGNVVDPVDQMEKYGADLPRFYSLRVAPPWEQTKYNEEEIKSEIYRLFNVYWNTVEFYSKYCKGNEIKPEQTDLRTEDKWILSRLNTQIKRVLEKVEGGLFHELTRNLEEFVLDDISRWYVKKVRKRAKSGDASACWTLGEVIKKTNLLFAPLAPHITEKIYQDLAGNKLSVHMEDFPEVEESRIDKELEKSMEIVRDIVEKAARVRDENQYILRWPAKKLIISTNKKTKERLEEFVDILKVMTNVKEVHFGEVSTVYRAKPNYPKIGPRFEKNAEEVANLIEELDHKQIEQLKNLGQIKINDYSVELEHINIIKSTEEDVESKPFEKGRIFIDLQMTKDIEKEAYVREVVREIQHCRKEAGLKVEDEVVLSFEGNISPLKNLENIIKDRINVKEIRYGETGLKHKSEVEFKGRKVKISFSDPE